MQISKLRVIAVAVIAMLSCASILAPDTAVARRKRNKLTIEVNGGDFNGRIVHRKDICKVEREVIVFQQGGAEPDPTTDSDIASDTTDDEGKWNTGNTGANDGRYYAHAPAITDCKVLTSKTVTVTGRPPEEDV
jgi:hypothetical protein